MADDKEKPIKATVELDADDLDKVVGGATGGKTVQQFRPRAEERQKFSDDSTVFTGKEQAKKGA